jgi:hypothetical protein
MGPIWGHWGVSDDRGLAEVFHLPSGRLLTSFAFMHHARLFCEAINDLTDWSSHAPPVHDKLLNLGLHAAALAVTGARPRLRVINGARATQ